MATQDEYIKTALRLPRDLHARIQESAEQTGKSMNAEIIARLETSFTQDTNSDAVLGLFQKLDLSFKHREAEKDRQRALLTEMLQFIIKKIVDDLQRAFVTFSSGKKITPEQLHQLELHAAEAEQFLHLLEKNSKFDAHLTDTEEDEDRHERLNADFEQEEPGLNIRNKP